MGTNLGQQEVTQDDIEILQEKVILQSIQCPCLYALSRYFGLMNSILSLCQVTQLEQAHPVPADIMIAKDTRVLLITGPNTGGKTICLKAVGVAAMMAKAGRSFIFFNLFLSFNRNISQFSFLNN